MPAPRTDFKGETIGRGWRLPIEHISRYPHRVMRPWIFAFLIVLGCGDDEMVGTGSATTSGSGGQGGAGGSTPVFRIASPSNGSNVYGSANVVVEVSGMTLGAVEFEHQEVICEDSTPLYSCLVDLSLEEDGSTPELVAKGMVDGAEVARDAITLTKVAPEAAICESMEPLADCLGALEDQGLAASNMGDFYDNLDGDHTALNVANHPDVTYLHTAYGTQSIGMVAEHQNPADALIGNASLCSSLGADCAGQLRWLISIGRAETLSQLYLENKFFWFPEHLDHDDVDKAHYMVPFTNNSQGSAGSEMEEVEKFLWAMAALPPETKATAIAAGTLMPAVQMIFRRTRVASDSEYLSGKAHANAYDDYDNALAMVQMAHFLEPAQVPAVAMLTVVEESWDMATEVVFTTPLSIARQWSGDTTRPRRIVVEAAASGASADAVLSYHWRVLRGDPAHVRISELEPDASRVEIEIDHHLEETVEVDGMPRLTKLVVVGAFVHDGAFLSAPSFITSYAP